MHPLFKNRVALVLIVLYLGLVAFWSWIRIQGLTEGPINNAYGVLYPLISLIGGLYGIFVVKNMGRPSKCYGERRIVSFLRTSCGGLWSMGVELLHDDTRG